MNKKLFLILFAFLLITSLSVNTSSFATTSEDPVSYEDDKYQIVKSYAANVTSVPVSDIASLAQTRIMNSETGEVMEATIKSSSTQKLYDLVNMTTGQQAEHFRTDFEIFADFQSSDNSSDKTGGITFYETIYYTSVQDSAFYDYVSINKVNYRFEKNSSGSSYSISNRKMDIHQNGMGIDGYPKSNQTKSGLSLIGSGTGTILPREYGWTPVNHPALASRVGTKTTATISNGSSSWDFSFSMNPR
ncbi:hypothetical protein [Paenibacillus sp. BR1-192]|uniref:hypothetical protein n=1 Tax=Paenibacillus sp. BR1-192 TaxID=3032287 RepID=UPI00240D89DF|nr:hypothetical protein [Paenibacillus sp. BR1-192]WFB59764.1 hypothetical protein P0X86_05885 [Paenibacillus sp. BR1-192]